MRANTGKKKKKRKFTLGPSAEITLISPGCRAKGNRPRYLVADDFLKFSTTFFLFKNKTQLRLYLYTLATDCNMKMRQVP